MEMNQTLFQFENWEERDDKGAGISTGKSDDFSQVSQENSDDADSDSSSRFSQAEPEKNTSVTWAEARAKIAEDQDSYACNLIEDNYEPLHYKSGLTVGD